jgi:hypothetical protein
VGAGAIGGLGVAGGIAAGGGGGLGGVGALGVLGVIGVTGGETDPDVGVIGCGKLATTVSVRGGPQPALGSAQGPGPPKASGSGSGPLRRASLPSLATSSGLKRSRVLELVSEQAPPAQGSRSGAAAQGPPAAIPSACAGAERSSATARATALRAKMRAWVFTGGSLRRISCRT